MCELFSTSEHPNVHTFQNHTCYNYSLTSLPDCTKFCMYVLISYSIILHTQWPICPAYFDIQLGFQCVVTEALKEVDQLMHHIKSQR